MDVLSSAIALLRLRTLHCGGFDLGPESCVRVPPSGGVKFYVVASGQCWLATEREKAPKKLEENHSFLLSTNRGFRLSALQVPSGRKTSQFSAQDCGKINTYDGGTACLVLGAHFSLEGLASELLLQSLPALIEFAQASDRLKLRWLLDCLAEELRAPQAGGVLVTQHLAQLLFVQAMRACIRSRLYRPSTWLGALTDSRMSRAVASMYQQPDRKWTVEELGKLVGMSRAAFARTFTELTGDSPLDHLTRWRMALASERLTTTQQTVAEVARSLGYESSSAFTKTFRRSTGQSPRDVRQARRNVHP